MDTIIVCINNINPKDIGCLKKFKEIEIKKEVININFIQRIV